MPALIATYRSRSASYERLSANRKLPKTLVLGVSSSGAPAAKGCAAGGAGGCWAAASCAVNRIVRTHVPIRIVMNELSSGPLPLQSRANQREMVITVADCVI